jgi:hypothetical protein
VWSIEGVTDALYLSLLEGVLDALYVWLFRHPWHDKSRGAKILDSEDFG